MKSEEIWKPIIGCPGYEVSNLGRVKSFFVYGSRTKRLGEQRIKRCFTNKNGYVTVSLSEKTYYVHSLVLSSFVGPRPIQHQCCHWNGIKSDNRLENLRWASSFENIKDSIRLGALHTILSEDQVLCIMHMCDVEKIASHRIAKKFGVSLGTIRQIRRGTSWKHLQAPRQHFIEQARRKRG